MLTDQLANALRKTRTAAVNPRQDDDRAEPHDLIALQLGGGFAIATAAILRLGAQTSTGVAIGAGMSVLLASLFVSSIAASRAESRTWNDCAKEYGR